MRKENAYFERNLEGIRGVTSKKSTNQISRTFERLMKKTKRKSPLCIKGKVVFGLSK